MNEVSLYILMRNDLASMNTGKACAQASHCSNAFIHKHGKMAEVKEWQKSTSQGFGTVLVLSVSGLELREAVEEADVEGFPSEIIYDPTYPYRTTAELASLIPKDIDTSPRFIKNGEATLFRNEMTCGYIFGTREELKQFIGKFPLHP